MLPAILVGIGRAFAAVGRAVVQATKVVARVTVKVVKSVGRAFVQVGKSVGRATVQATRAVGKGTRKVFKRSPRKASVRKSSSSFNKSVRKSLERRFRKQAVKSLNRSLSSRSKRSSRATLDRSEQNKRLLKERKRLSLREVSRNIQDFHRKLEQSGFIKVSDGFETPSNPSLAVVAISSFLVGAVSVLIARPPKFFMKVARLASNIFTRLSAIIIPDEEKEVLNPSIPSSKHGSQTGFRPSSVSGGGSFGFGSFGSTAFASSTSTASYTTHRGISYNTVGGTYSSGVRNNNPLNVTVLPSTPWQGQVSSYKLRSAARPFAAFSDPFYSIKAAYTVMLNYPKHMTPARQKVFNDQSDGHSYTLRVMLYIYAPPSENATNTYLEFVVKNSGLLENELMSNVLSDKIKFTRLFQAMGRFESGTAFSDNYLSLVFDSLTKGAPPPLQDILNVKEDSTSSSMSSYHKSSRYNKQ